MNLIEWIMKNKHLFSAVVALLLLSPHAAMSQNWFYHNEGDTIRGRDTTYHYQWWGDDWLASDASHKLRIRPFMLGFTNHGTEVCSNYTPHPLRVVGIATSFYTYVQSWMYAVDHKIPCGFLEPCDTAPQFQEYVLLYEADSVHPEIYEVGRIPMDYSRPPRYMDVGLRCDSYNGFNCCEPSPDSHKLVKIREYYFDSPIVVRDSFYVGHTLNSTWWPGADVSNPYGEWIFSVACWATGFIIGYDCAEREADGCDVPPLQKYKFKASDYQQLPDIDTNVWIDVWYSDRVIEFPIIEIDTESHYIPYVCPPVQNFRLADLGRGVATFMWDTHGDHNAWQLCYGPVGVDPDSGTIVDCTLQVGQIMGLDSCTDYAVYCRAVCEHDSTVYSSWSLPIRFSICDTTGGAVYDTIDTGSQSVDNSLARFVQILPNPANGIVQVLSSFNIFSIEVCDLRGHSFWRHEADGHNVGFSVEGWPVGTYFVLIRTANGNFTKKLIVSPR